MEILIIEIMTIFFGIVSFIYFKEISKKEKKISSLTNELLKTITELNKEKKIEKQIIFGLVNKPNEKDTQLLFQNQECINAFLKIIHYEIFKSTELTRGQNGRLDNDTMRENIGRLNGFHYLNLVINKIKNGTDILKEEDNND